VSRSQLLAWQAPTAAAESAAELAWRKLLESFQLPASWLQQHGISVCEAVLLLLLSIAAVLLFCCVEALLLQTLTPA
jgi:non-ribosomal peptide synthetase component E (peptide arylation enzyme)